MGGPGSTRWTSFDKKLTVEDCLCLSISDLIRVGISLTEVKQVNWLMSPYQRTVGCAFFKLDLRDLERPAVWIDITRNIAGEICNQQQVVYLDRTVCNAHGGMRWWFLCPSPTGVCNHRRSEKLFLKPDGMELGCRKCYDLSYKSCQRWNPPDLWRRRHERNPFMLVNIPQSSIQAMSAATTML